MEPPLLHAAQDVEGALHVSRTGAFGSQLLPAPLEMHGHWGWLEGRGALQGAATWEEEGARGRARVSGSWWKSGCGEGQLGRNFGAGEKVSVESVRDAKDEAIRFWQKKQAERECASTRRAKLKFNFTGT